MTSFTESHFFSRHFRLLPVVRTPVLWYSPVSRLHDFLIEAGVERSAIPAFEDRVRQLMLAKIFMPFQTRDVARQLLKILDELTLSRGKTTWIEKTPMHLHFISLLEKLAENPQQIHFVHVIRDGLEVVSSLYKASKHWEYQYNLEAAVARWNKDVGLSLRRINATNDHFVSYDALTARTGTTLKRLLTELGLEWEPEILERYAGASHRLITPDETWKSNVDRVVRRSATSGHTLTEEQRRRVNASLQHRSYAKIIERTGETVAATGVEN